MKSKNILKLSVLAGTIALLSACKTDITANIPFSGLLSDGIKETKAELKVEVPACEDFQDSRKESDALVRAKAEIQQMIPSVEFKECYKERFNSFATFSLPINYGNGSVEDWEKTGNISLITLSKEDKTINFLYIPAPIQKAVKSSQDDKFNVSQFKVEDISININLENDTDKNIVTVIPSAFVNGEPSQNLEFEIEKGKTANIVLSDVTTHIAFKANPADSAFILKDIKSK